MDRTDEYRQKATSSLLLAKRVTDEAMRVRLLNYALYWFRLAELADKNYRSDLTYEWPPRPEGRNRSQNELPAKRDHRTRDAA